MEMTQLMESMNKQLSLNMNDFMIKTMTGIMEPIIETINDLKEEFGVFKSNQDKNTLEVKTLKEEQSFANGRIATIESKTNVLDFDEDGKFKELKDICKKRVFNLCGNDESNPEYILFYRTLIINIYNYLSETLHVNRTGKIKIEDFEGAKSLARNYRPDARKINKKFETLFKAYDNGTLNDKSKEKAVSDILDAMDGSFNVRKLFGGKCI